MLGPHRRNSFSYKAINPIIKNILDERSTLDNTVQVGMPFIKVSSTIDMGKIAGYDSENINNYGFTLGVHAIDKDLKYQDMYSNQSGEYLIGYTYQPNGTTKKIYTPVPDSVTKGTINILDKGVALASNTDFSFIPPPGITSATIGRNRNGVISIAQIKISVPTLPQLEALHRTFLIPGVGMIVEWGQQFAPKQRTSFGELGIRSDTIENHMFPWYERDALNALMFRLALNKIGLEEILENYVYPTQGQYQWMYGKVANFSINANSDGSFDCNVKIVGPSEDSFAYSTRNTIIPPKLIKNEQNIVCSDKSNSVETYFTTTVEGKNFKTLVEAMADGSSLPGLEGWAGHVVKFDKNTGFLASAGRAIAGAAVGLFRLVTGKGNKTSEESFGDSEDAYLMTWRFFVNVVLNDEQYGIKSIFKDALLTDEELQKVSILRPYTNPGLDARSSVAEKLTDPYENFVGNNKFLRSTDPSTLVIVNEAAAIEAEKELQRRSVSSTIIAKNNDTDKLLAKGDFYESTTHITDPTQTNGGVNDRGFLSTGVWVNHKAVVQAMASSQNILGGINNLLHRMNSATHNFWQLAIDPSEPESGDEASFNYGIVDVNYKESSEYAVTEFFDKVHVFNKYIRDTNGVLVGSEVIESNIDLNLPKLLFSQISTTGLYQESDMSEISPVENDSAVDHPKIPGQAEQFRKMFSITSIAPTGEFDGGPDLTQLSKAARRALIEGAVCGESNTQTTAGTAGRRQGSAARDASDVLGRGNSEKKIKNGNKQLEDINKKIQFCDQFCITAPGEITSEETETEVVPDVPEAIDPLTNYCLRLSNANEKRFCESARAAGITDPIELAQLLAQVGHESGFVARAENLNYRAATLFNLFPRTSSRSWGFADLADAQRTVDQGQVAIGNRIYGSRMDNNGEGFKYRGRGFIQLTGRENYRSFSNFSGVDSVANPDYILTEKGATDSTIWYWKTRVRRDSTLAGNYANIERVTRLINGGQIGIEDRRNKFARITSQFNISIPNTPGIPSGPPRPQYSSRVVARTREMDWPFGSNPGEGRTGRRPGSNLGLGLSAAQVVRDVDNSFNCSRCDGFLNTKNILETAIAAERQKLETENAIERATSENPELENAFRYIEMLPDWMVTQITNSGNDIFSNAFGAAPGTLSIGGDLVLMGINGLRVGELFWIDRIPSFYRAFGAFQVMSLEDSIGRDGWTTKIHARFNYLGGAWTKSTSDLLARGTLPERPTITQLDVERVGTI
jgi:putative chitinase